MAKMMSADKGKGLQFKKDSGEKPKLLDVFITPYHLVQAWEEYESAAEAIMKPAELTHTQGFVLLALFYSDIPLTATQLALIARREPHSMVQLLDKFQERKLVRRRRSRADRRLVVVTLTDQGRQLIRSIIPAWQSVLRSIFYERFSADELRNFHEMLHKVRDASIYCHGTDQSQAESIVRQVADGIRNVIQA